MARIEQKHLEMMFSREAEDWRWVKQKIVSKCQQSFGSFPLKIQTEFILYVAVTSQLEGGGSFCCFYYVCIIITIAENIAIHNLPEKVDAN